MTSIFDRALEERQKTATRLLSEATNRQRLANAYLFTGRNAADKWLIAKQLACFLNCTEGGRCLEKLAGELSADACQNCRWIWAAEHPQALLTLVAADGSKTGKIAVEKTRLLVEELVKTSRFKRVVVIPDSSQDILHRPSANALLKTLEEPGPHCLFLLFANDANDVLPTVVSRCQIIPVAWLHDGLLQGAGEPACALDQEIDMRKATLAQALAWSSRLLDNAQQQDSAQVLIDIVVSKEVERFKTLASDDPAVSRYLSRLLELAQEAKLALEHFVKPHYAIETFVVAWQRLGQAS
jgi:DNA polymerase III delta prime subunit